MIIPTYPVKEAVEVHVETVAVGGVKQDVFPVPVPQSQNVPHHGHHGHRLAVGQTRIVPETHSIGTVCLFYSYYAVFNTDKVILLH